jgi:hypothetical protein
MCNERCTNAGTGSRARQILQHYPEENRPKTEAGRASDVDSHGPPQRRGAERTKGAVRPEGRYVPGHSPMTINGAQKKGLVEPLLNTA